MHLELSMLSIFFIFSMDIKCLYTMFPTIEGLEALNMFWANALFKNPSLQVPYLLILSSFGRLVSEERPFR